MTDEFTDEQIEQYEQELGELSEKDLLIHQLVELQRIRYTLEIMASNPADEPEGAGTYECLRCGDEIPENELETHAKNAHGWHTDIGLESVYRM